MKYAAEYRAAADRNPELIDRLLRSLEQGSEEQRECKGDSPDDDVSKAVAWSGKNINSSPCYVAIVYEWYKAIIADPPGLINGISIGDFPPHLRYVDANEVRLPPGPGYLMYVGCGYGSRGSDVHRGRADLIALIQSVGKVWNVSHPNQPFLVGDITSPNSCHASHLVGEDVDLAWPTDASRAGYSAAFAQEFLSMYVLGGAEVIFFTPLDGRMGNAAMDAVVQQWPNHTNHSHVRIDGARGTYPGKVLRLIEPIPRGGV
jgi:hypothetical protein